MSHMLRLLSGIFLLTLFAPALSLAGQKALVIGASEYPHLPPKSQLPGAARDADKFATFLVEEWNFEERDVKVIKGRSATKKAIVSAIKTHLRDGSVKGDKLVFYFSGHGSQITDKNGDERQDGKDEALVPSDVRKVYDNSATKYYLSDDEIKKLFAPLKDRQVLMVIDACHSGTVTRAGPGSDTTDVRQRYHPSHLPPAPRFDAIPFTDPATETFSDEFAGVALTAAALPHQYSWEDGNLGGIFTHHFIEGLTNSKADLNKNGRISISEQIAYLRWNTEQWCESVQVCKEKRVGFSPNFEPKSAASKLVSDWKADQNPEEADPSDIIPAVNADTLSLQLIGAKENNSLKLEDTFRIEISSRKGGFVTLFDVRANGELELLYPFDEDELLNITSDRELKLPRYSDGFDLVASEPLGKGQLLLVVTEEKVDFANLIAKTRSINAMAGAEETLGDFAAELMEALTNEAYQTEDGDWAGVRLPKWSATSLEYFVE